jgi:5,10-methylenetetrahydrofolate reductase
MENGKTRETSFPDVLRSRSIVSVELRPPRASRSGPESIDDWIDTYHTIRSLNVGGTYVFITDNAVGQLEEENLRHLVVNLGPEASKSHIIPFLTCKHTLDYCLRYSERAYEHGFRTLVVLGGDRHDGVPRCVDHAHKLREQIRRRVPGLALGGWANPHADTARQVDYLVEGRECTDFFLTQVVSHHRSDAVIRFLDETVKRDLRIPGIFGVFYYRSARPATLETLQQFFTVPRLELEKEFNDAKLSADQICGRSIHGLRELGVRHIYVSNLPVADAPARLRRLMSSTRKSVRAPASLPE